MDMTYTEQTAYISKEITRLCIRLCNEGVDVMYACLLDQAAYGYANLPGAEGMHRVFRETADEMEAGEYIHKTVLESRPTLRLVATRSESGAT